MAVLGAVKPRALYRRLPLPHALSEKTESGARTVLSGIRIPTNYGSRYTDAFTSAFEDVASATGADYMPFLIEEVALRTELMQADGIHPNEAAQPIIADHVLEHIEPLLANCTAPSLTTGS